VTLGFVVRGCRARQDELARKAPIVDGATDGIPYTWGALPFVQEAWGVAVKEQLGVERGAPLGFGVSVEEDLADGSLPGGRGLPATLDTFDENRAHRAELIVEEAVGQARQVGTIGKGRSHLNSSMDKNHTFQ